MQNANRGGAYPSACVPQKIVIDPPCSYSAS